MVFFLCGLGVVLPMYSQSSQPNFLIAMGDDISATNIGCYGSANLHASPNIDQLANWKVLEMNNLANNP